MRLILAGTLATLTAASLAIIRPALLTEDEREATQSIRESRWRADVRFLSSDLLEGRAPGAMRQVRAIESREVALASNANAWSTGSRSFSSTAFAAKDDIPNSRTSRAVAVRRRDIVMK